MALEKDNPTHWVEVLVVGLIHGLNRAGAYRAIQTGKVPVARWGQVLKVPRHAYARYLEASGIVAAGKGLETIEAAEVRLAAGAELPAEEAQPSRQDVVTKLADVADRALAARFKGTSSEIAEAAKKAKT